MKRIIGLSLSFSVWYAFYWATHRFLMKYIYLKNYISFKFVNVFRTAYFQLPFCNWNLKYFYQFFNIIQKSTNRGVFGCFSLFVWVFLLGFVCCFVLFLKSECNRTIKTDTQPYTVLGLSSIYWRSMTLFKLFVCVCLTLPVKLLAVKVVRLVRWLRKLNTVRKRKWRKNDRN